MIFDTSIDSIEDILSIRRAIIQGNFIENGGLTIVSYTIEGNSVQKQWPISPKLLLEETALFLRKADPASYGKFIKRTVPTYS